MENQLLETCEAVKIENGIKRGRKLGSKNKPKEGKETVVKHRLLRLRSDLHQQLMEASASEFETAHGFIIQAIKERIKRLKQEALK